MVTPMRSRDLHDDLQTRGHRGGEILPHRSIWSLQLPRTRLWSGALLAAAFTLLLAALQPWIASVWSAELTWWMHALELPGQFEAARIGARDLVSMPVPMIDVRLRDMSAAAMGLHAVAAVALWIGSGWLPDGLRPAAFLLRFAVLIHAMAIGYFLLWPASFPHSLSSHVAGGLRQIWALMLLTPWLHLCIHYLFPFAAWQRAALTATTLLFLFVLAPLLFASHTALLHALGVVAMPVLHLLLGVMVPIVGFVALYGWAMSWGRGPAPDPA